VSGISCRFKFKFGENLSKDQEMEENVVIRLKLGKCRVCGHAAQHWAGLGWSRGRRPSRVSFSMSKLSETSSLQYFYNGDTEFSRATGWET
jgi:hypothetical protein